MYVFLIVPAAFSVKSVDAYQEREREKVCVCEIEMGYLNVTVLTKFAVGPQFNPQQIITLIT